MFLNEFSIYNLVILLEGYNIPTTCTTSKYFESVYNLLRALYFWNFVKISPLLNPLKIPQRNVSSLLGEYLINRYSYTYIIKYCTSFTYVLCRYTNKRLTRYFMTCIPSLYYTLTFHIVYLCLSPVLCARILLWFRSSYFSHLFLSILLWLHTFFPRYKSFSV